MIIVYLLLTIAVLLLLSLANALRLVAFMYRVVASHLIERDHVQRFGETDDEYRSRISDMVDNLYDQVYADWKASTGGNRFLKQKRGNTI